MTVAAKAVAADVDREPAAVDADILETTVAVAERSEANHAKPIAVNPHRLIVVTDVIMVAVENFGASSVDSAASPVVADATWVALATLQVVPAKPIHAARPIRAAVAGPAAEAAAHEATAYSIAAKANVAATVLTLVNL